MTTTLMRLIQKSMQDPQKALSNFAHRILTPLGHRQFKRFVVLSRSRTGSNMLIQMLNSHPNIAADYEIFGELKGQSEQTILDKVFSKQPFYIKAKGFKIFYYHPRDSDSTLIWDMLESMDGLHIIHLKRRDILRTLVSSRIAYATGIYGVRSAKEMSEYKKKLKSIIYPPEQLRAHFEETKAWQKDAKERFKNHPMISIDYEDLVSDKDNIFRTITDFLEVSYRQPKTDFKKQGIKSLRDMLENYGELKTEFNGTQWEIFFDE